MGVSAYGRVRRLPDPSHPSARSPIAQSPIRPYSPHAIRPHTDIHPVTRSHADRPRSMLLAPRSAASN